MIKMFSVIYCASYITIMILHVGLSSSNTVTESGVYPSMKQQSEVADNIAAADTHEHKVIILVPTIVKSHGKHPVVHHTGKVVHTHNHKGHVDHVHSHKGKAAHGHKHSGHAGHKHNHAGVGIHKHSHLGKGVHGHKHQGIASHGHKHIGSNHHKHSHNGHGDFHHKHVGTFHNTHPGHKNTHYTNYADTFSHVSNNVPGGINSNTNSKLSSSPYSYENTFLYPDHRPQVIQIRIPTEYDSDNNENIDSNNDVNNNNNYVTNNEATNDYDRVGQEEITGSDYEEDHSADIESDIDGGYTFGDGYKLAAAAAARVSYEPSPETDEQSQDDTLYPQTESNIEPIAYSDAYHYRY